MNLNVDNYLLLMAGARGRDLSFVHIVFSANNKKMH